MHKLAKEIMDRVKSKINSCGVDGITEQELIEMKYWTCVAEAMVSYDYHYKIIEEMEKPENQYGVNYDENGRFYTPPRMSNGQFRNDMRKHYDEMYDMSPVYYRDMDMPNGRMYYTDSNGSRMATESSNMNSSNSNMTNRGYSESRYDKARKGYEESKMMNPEMDNMEKVQEIFEVLESDIKELKPKMSPSEKAFAKNKLVNMSNSMV